MFAQNTGVTIAKFILVETGTYQEQHLRPFETNIQTDHINQLERRTHGGRSIGIEAVQDVAGEILRPQGTPERRVNIANGWTSRRFRFLMVVHEKSTFMNAGKYVRVYFGYTDQCDASFNHLDPNMRIYFNSETTVVEHVRPTLNGVDVKAQVAGSNQIVTPFDMSGAAGFINGQYATPSSYLIRPDDVFSYGQGQQVIEQMRATGQYDNDTVLYNARGMVGQGGAYKYSRRNDTSPARYLAKTLDGFWHAKQEMGMDTERGDMDVFFGNAVSRAENQDIHSTTFFEKLKNGCGYMEKGFVTLAELEQVFPEIPHVTTFSMNRGESMRKVSEAQDSQHWRGSDKITIAAASLAQTIPAIMMDEMIRSISFAATNGRGYGEYFIEIHQNTYSVVDNLDMIPHIEEFKRRLVTDVLNTITYRNQVYFRISMQSDLAGESVIDIELDDEPLTRYVAPTFGDSLFTPLVTQDQSRYESLSNDLLYLTQQVVGFEGPGPMAQQPQTPGAAVAPGQPIQGSHYEHNDSGLL